MDRRVVELKGGKRIGTSVEERHVGQYWKGRAERNSGQCIAQDSSGRKAEYWKGSEGTGRHFYGNGSNGRKGSAGY